MAHFAQIDENNLVIQVLTIDNSEESRGQDFLVNDLQLGGKWIQTSYNAKIRGNYAGVGFSYLEAEDIFMPPKCHETATLDSKVAKWICDDPSHEIKELNANN
jgi:hypothetical protein